ncbi:glycosyltransferase family 2 protein [Microbulbifer agarilyticus]|uniref:glycosyltransferase family 2 protein n=1 Tax=Microbulbifer agarilyticus TaxID=260552 RepID=UPI001C93F835|nr:glycosyltransferase family 2 protein [Microbulbifer agarilyticus]MBY6212249.1 glycosyltransferase family 2 protein [Microbulbifer agarilyticus]
MTPNPPPKNYRIFISIVSHGHEELIIDKLRPSDWQDSSGLIIPAILSNIPSPGLRKYCENNKIIYLENTHPQGFGQNNNEVFKKFKTLLKIAIEDYFFCVNPDVQTSMNDIIKLATTMSEGNYQIAAPNLVNSFGQSEDNIRNYPTLLDCALRLFAQSNRSVIDKSKLHEPTNVEWASGAFLCFKSDVFESINGFDERYYMYYEDADICYRANKLGVETTYIPQVTAIHDGKRASRNFFSKLAFHHIKSALRFVYTKTRI